MEKNTNPLTNSTLSSSSSKAVILSSLSSSLKNSSGGFNGISSLSLPQSDYNCQESIKGTTKELITDKKLIATPYFLNPLVEVPKIFSVINNLLIGTILVRVSSKIIFRKWKSVFFILSNKKLEFYISKVAWELNQEPFKSYEIHSNLELTTVCKQRTSSIGESDSNVFSVRLVECLGIEEPQVTTNSSFISDAEFGISSSRICPDEFLKKCKFGSKVYEEMIFLSNAIRCVIQKRDGSDLGAAQNFEIERRERQSLPHQ